MQMKLIIGTDTEIGKTYCCVQIMQYLIQFRKQMVAALKPISSGVMNCEYGELNEDVYKLFKASNVHLEFTQINPFSFRPAIAPHIAAKQENKILNVHKISSQINEITKQMKFVDHLLIEGVGGLMVPLNDNETYLDLLAELDHPIILVVGMKLGCLNHALLTATILKQNKLPLIGFIANQINPDMEYFAENLEYLTQKLSVPLLATIPYNSRIQPTNHFNGVFQ